MINWASRIQLKRVTKKKNYEDYDDDDDHIDMYK